MAIQDEIADGLKEGLDYKTEFHDAAQSLFRVSGAEEIIPVPPEGKIRLDLACGRSCRDGYVGLDRVPGPGVSLVHDLTVRPWPVETDGVSEARAWHIVEHLVDLVGFMEEAYRVLMPGGFLHIACPYYSHTRAWRDPTHVRGINQDTFFYFDKTKVSSLGIQQYGFQCDFELVSMKEILEPAWESRALEAQKWAAKHLCNVIMDLELTLRAVKPMREES